jgi:hypothetical protein
MAIVTQGHIRSAASEHSGRTDQAYRTFQAVFVIVPISAGIVRFRWPSCRYTPLSAGTLPERTAFLNLS